MYKNAQEMFGDKLRIYRENLGESQEVFAARFHKNRSTLSLIEKGSQAPDLDLLIDILKFTKMDPYSLLNIDYSKIVIVSDDVIINRPQKFRDDIRKTFDRVMVPDIVIKKIKSFKDYGNESQQTIAEWFFDVIEHDSSNKFVRMDTTKYAADSISETLLYASQALAKDNRDDMFYLLTDDYSVRLMEIDEKLSNFVVLNSEEYYERFKSESVFNNLKSQKFCAYIEIGDVGKAKFLLSENINVNCIDEKSGLTPLIISIKQGNRDVFDWLLTLDGIDVNVCDDQKHRLPPISHVIRADSISPSDKNYMVSELIKHGANVNEPSCSDLNPINTPLMIASWHGEYEIVKMLVECGACIDQQDKANGYTPLIKAVINRHVSVIEFLLSCGANRDIFAHNKRYYMKKAIDIAYEENCNNRNSEIIRLLNTVGK